MRGTTAVVLLLSSAAGCASAPVTPAAREPEPARARAALSALSVDNRTAERVIILYRLTTRPDAEVVVGQVPPQSFREIAPVPAGEPLILVARTSSGAEVALDARAFAIDGEWTWVIPADTRFTRGPFTGAGG
jgi:hypothetical protein